jgi:hypothetical protein
VLDSTPHLGKVAHANHPRVRVRVRGARADASGQPQRHGRRSAQGRGARARQGGAPLSGSTKLRDAGAGGHRRAAPEPPLLQQGRAPAVALRVARDRRLAAAAGSRGGVVRRPARARPGRPGAAHPAAHPAGRRGPRRRHGRGRLRLRLRAGVPPRVHLRDPDLDAAGVHGVLRVPGGAAAPDGRVRERRGAADGGRRGAGPARLVGPAPGRHQGPVLAGLLADALRRGALRPRPAAGGARVQARGGRRPRRDVRAGGGDAAGDGVLRHRLLHRRHGREQRLPGESPRVARPLLLRRQPSRRVVSLLLPTSWYLAPSPNEAITRNNQTTLT